MIRLGRNGNLKGNPQMTSPHPHAIAALLNHDEAARTEFVQSFKVHLATKVMPGNRTVRTHRL